jgi:hypothetical protein
LGRFFLKTIFCPTDGGNQRIKAKNHPLDSSISWGEFVFKTIFCPTDANPKMKSVGLFSASTDWRKINQIAVP